MKLVDYFQSDIIREMQLIRPFIVYLLIIDDPVEQTITDHKGNMRKPFYIGYSFSFNFRMNEHLLAAELQQDKPLYRRIIEFMGGEYREEKIRFYVLYEGQATREDAELIEAKYINKYQAHIHGMNTSAGRQKVWQDE